MKADDIVRQLFAVLPRLTNLFSQELSISSLTRSGTTVTAVTASNHLLSTGDYVNILNAKAPITISSITRDIPILSIERSGQTAVVTTNGNHNLPDGTNVTISGADQTEYNVTVNITVLSRSKFSYLVNGAPITPATGIVSLRLTSLAIATTISDHDLTESQRLDGQPLTVDIEGADQTEYNGINNLIVVPNRQTFIYEIDGDPATPATGTIYLRNNNPIRGYNGRFEVTVVDPTTFTYQVSSTPESPAQGSPIVRAKHRISKSASLLRANDSYTKQAQNNLWAYVVLENATASQSRQTVTDATARISIGTAFRQPRIEQFSVYVFVPTTNEIAAANARDLMSDVARYLFKSLLGVKLPTYFTNKRHDGIVWSGEANVTDVTAYYIHQFIFETTVDITGCDIIEPSDSVAFRDINIDYSSNIKSSDDIIMQSEINLDDDPL